MIDATHDPRRQSWVESANAHSDFPIQNLPMGVFSPEGATPRGGVAIGDAVLDLGIALELGLFDQHARDAAEVAAGPTLNDWMRLSAPKRRALRQRLSEILDAGGPDRSRIAAAAGRLLHDADGCELLLPVAIGNYTDFFAGIQHATNTGRLFRPDNPLLPNYKYLPVAYHGRASSVRPSGTPVHRPSGQRKLPEESAPNFGPCRNLDFELELAVWIGPGNELGSPIPVTQARDHIAGFGLLNDWSARDVQAWEYQPLGPFLAKSFCTSVSPWIVTAEAMAPFRQRQPERLEGDPLPLPYLTDDADRQSGALNIELEVQLLTEAMRAAGIPAYRLTATNAQALYWTVAQMVAHHTSNGCNLLAGDLFGSGTISGADPASFGSLLEKTSNGRQPLALPSGETRRFLEDGDEIILRGRCRRDGFVPIGFGECRGRIIPASR